MNYTNEMLTIDTFDDEIIDLVIWADQFRDEKLPPLIRNLIGSLDDYRLAIVVYELDRAYGGPEEGGWYYTAYSVVKSETIDNDDETIGEMFERAQSRREWVASEWADKEYGQLGSYGDSQHFATYLELLAPNEAPGKQERNGRPHYE